MKYLPKNTLAYFNAAPQFKAHDLSKVLVPVVAKATVGYKAATIKVSPDVEAIRFYGLNHCASIIRSKFTPSEPLPEWAVKVMNAYQECMVAQSERMLHYMMLITIREARHIYPPSDKLKKDVAAAYGQEMVDFLLDGKGKNENVAMDNYLDHAPQVSVAQYCGALAHVFDHGKWSGGYGGKPWGMIAKTLLSMYQGHTSLEMMVDTAYTLAHNNGPQFNKGMLYEGYTPTFMMILDIQRSGQIPELLLDPTSHVAVSLPPDVVALVKEVKAACPGEFGDYVDWVKVEALGAVGSYSSQKAAQKKLHAAPVVTKFMGKVAKQIGEFQVVPGQSIPMFERKAA